MATEVFMPKWGLSMQQGRITQWLKQEGDRVEKGEPLLEVETEKIAGVVEAPSSGILARTLYPVGSSAPVSQVIALITAPGEAVPDIAVPAEPAAEAAAGAPPPVSGARARPATIIPATPVARRMAKQHGLDLAVIQATGPNGTVTKDDVEKAIQGQPQTVPPQVVPMEGIRRTIATRLLQSLQTMAQVTVTTEANVAEAMALRQGLSRHRTEGSLSPLHLVIKATARALKEHPRLNALQLEDRVQLVDQVNIGVAVSLAEGLITPVIRDADTKGLAEIASEGRELAAKTREGRATPDDVTGGTFTISNLGTYEIDAFTPIINPPQVGILGVGRVVEKPIVANGEVTKGSMMVLSLTFDHRVVDGAPAAEFLQTVKKHLEDPWWMVA
ncbi:MAG: dihydrolipoamide acetyltransferase family protein [Candidatus Neomarinimicrobiota bacterium]